MAKKKVIPKKQEPKPATPVQAEGKLTAKQEMFCQEYLVDLNATQAAIRAGYSEDTAAVIGCENLIKPNIAERIAVLQKERSERTKITQDMVLLELARIGFSDMKEYMEWGPRGVKLRDSSELTQAQSCAVSEVSESITEAGRTLKLKLHDKRAALKDIGQHLGMFTEKHEHSGEINLIEVLRERSTESQKKDEVMKEVPDLSGKVR